MDTTANPVPPFAVTPSGGIETTDRREEYRRVEKVQQRLVRSACPIRVEVEREILAARSPRRVKALTLRPSCFPTCATMCAAAPNP